MTTVESVWEYPRPPVLRRVVEQVVVEYGGGPVAECGEALQVLETSHPPTYYLPEAAFVPGVLVPIEGSTWCEFKGRASYFDIAAGGMRARRAAWHYPEPTAGYEPLRGYVAVMAGLVDACFVNGERVTPQPGGFYGGWITSRVSGPFKGGPGTLGW